MSDLTMWLDNTSNPYYYDTNYGREHLKFEQITTVNNQIDLDRAAALAILRYYKYQADKALGNHRKSVYRPHMPDKVHLAMAFLTTVLCEARHSAWEAPNVDPRAVELLDWIDTNELMASCNTKGDCRNDILVGSIAQLRSEQEQRGNKDFLYFVAMMLRSAYYVFRCFGPDFEGSYGGVGGLAWAYCSWVSSDFIGAMASRGYTDDLLWELVLNAAHNNSGWLNKIASGRHMTLALHIGFKWEPVEIITLVEAIDDGDIVLPMNMYGNYKGSNNWDRAVARLGPVSETQDSRWWEPNPIYREFCSFCGYLEDDCLCEECPHCGNIECTCDYCISCGHKEGECLCLPCSACDEMPANCGCIPCPICLTKAPAGTIACTCSITCAGCGRTEYEGCICPLYVPKNCHALTFNADPEAATVPGVLHAPSFNHLNYYTSIEWKANPYQFGYKSGSDNKQWDKHQPWWGVKAKKLYYEIFGDLL